MKVPSIFYAIIMMKCPRCRMGNLFSLKNPYRFKTIDKMPLHCTACGQSFFPEVGFYYGAMYLSYMLSVGVSVLDVFAIWLLFGFNLWTVLDGNIFILAILFPYIYRYSRVLWIYFNVGFSKDVYRKVSGM